jgi:hypothetical protein
MATLWSVPAQLIGYPHKRRKSRVVHGFTTPGKHLHPHGSESAKCLMKKGKIAVVHRNAAPLSIYY